MARVKRYAHYLVQQFDYDDSWIAGIFETVDAAVEATGIVKEWFIEHVGEDGRRFWVYDKGRWRAVTVTEFEVGKIMKPIDLSYFEDEPND